MKKMIFAVCALVLAVIVTGPLLAAWKTEDELNRLLTQINTDPAYSLEWVSYDKGWLATDAVMAATLNNYPNPLAPAVLPVQVRVNHGPLLIADGFSVGWFSGHVHLAEEQDGWLKDRLTPSRKGPIWQTRMHMDLAGLLSFHDASQPFDLLLEETRVQVAEYRGEGRLRPSGTLEYSAELPRVQLYAEGSELHLERIELLLTLDLNAAHTSYVMPGQGKLIVGSVNGSGPDDDVMHMTDFRLSTKSQLDATQTLADMDLAMSFGSLDFLGEKLDNAVFEASLKRMSLAFLQRYSEASAAVEVQADIDLALLALELMQPILSDLLPNGPSLSLSPVAFSTPEGSLEFSADVKVSPDAVGLNSVFELAQYLTVDAALVVDKALAVRMMEQSTRRDLLAEQFEGGGVMSDADLEETARRQAQFKLNMMVIQRMLVQEKGRYRAVLSYANGQALLNGQPVPLPF